MQERELRLALICYGGVSLAVYMHGITKEIWHLARASRAFHAGDPPLGGTAAVYRRMLEEIQAASALKLRVMPDILSGASAGGINAIFLAHALETGQSLEPLTRLWLDKADADELLVHDRRPLVRFTKFWAAPLLWLLWRRGNDTVARTVAPEAREEVRRKLANFVRARWFRPPFGGARFAHLLLDAFDAMAEEPAGPPLLPEGHPLDLFVTATDFAGHEEALALHSPRVVLEPEHRLSIGFAARGAHPRRMANVPDLVLAARATASFPGAFPPFTVRELDGVLAARRQAWPGRAPFLRRILPRHSAAGTAEDTVLIDGSVLSNAPFAQAIDALRNRPARREVDRRIVYIEPTPRAVRHRGDADGRLPGFFRTIVGAISNIPRSQPIRDDLDHIAQRSARIDRMRQVVEAMRPGIDATIADTIGQPLFMDRPTPARLAAWRAKAHRRASSGAGFAYAAYGQLKLGQIIADRAALFTALSGAAETDCPAIAARLRRHLAESGVDGMARTAADQAEDRAAIHFLRAHDAAFRIRRLRFLARRLAEREEASEASHDPAAEQGRTALRGLLYEGIGQFAARGQPDFYGPRLRAIAAHAVETPAAVLDAFALADDLIELDTRLEERLAEALAALHLTDRRRMLQAYLGFPFYDIATLPMLQGEGLDEYDPVKIDRISPDDCSALRTGGAAATLKGIEFNTFGAFFSRAYRENDYLWGRLHGAERLADIVLSAALPPGVTALPDSATLKAALFRAILDQEEERLPHCATLIADLRAILEGR